MTGFPSSGELLEVLSERAALSVDQALTLPAGLYRSQDILELEISNIFNREWLCAGRADAIPASGDYLTFNIGVQPVVIIRQKDQSVRAFANVCRHRMMLLKDGLGTCAQNRLVCPYHGWTYATDGRLIGAPHMQDRPGFDKSSYRLHEIRCELWKGWIYVTLNNRASSVETRLRPLARLVEPYRMERYIQFVQQDHIWKTNWKLLTENFMEGYHLPVAHAATVGVEFSPAKVEFSESGSNPYFTYQKFSKSENLIVGTAHPDNTRLRGLQRITSIMPTIFPSHMMVLAPDHLWYLSLQPHGVDHVQIRFGASLAPEVHQAQPDVDDFIAELISFFDKVNEEDRYVVEGIMQGMQAGLSTPGPLCRLESEIQDFIRYLASRLCQVVAGRSVG